MSTTGVFAGSFDPPTLGHLDLIRRILKFKICDHLDIAVGNNSTKQTLFTVDERLQLINQLVDNMIKLNEEILYGSSNFRVVSFNSLLIDYAKSVNATILFRGIRSVSDFEYESNLANLNKMLAPEIETVFLPTSPELAAVSSSAAKEIARYQGDVSKLVTPEVAEKLYNKFSLNLSLTKEQSEQLLKGTTGFIKYVIIGG